MEIFQRLVTFLTIQSGAKLHSYAINVYACFYTCIQIIVQTSEICFNDVAKNRFLFNSNKITNNY